MTMRLGRKSERREKEKEMKAEEQMRKLIEKGKKTEEIYKYLGERMPKIPSILKMRSFKQKKAQVRKAV